MGKKPATRPRETRLLVCDLTEDEISERAKQLAVSKGEMEQHQLHAKEIKADLKKKGEQLRAQISQLARACREGKEEREIVCELLYDEDELTVDVVRVDTGQVVSSRPMTDDERQTLIPGAD